MSQIFDFSNREYAESTMKKTWNDFRTAFARGYLKYNEVEKAKKVTFLKVFDNLFCNHGGINYLTKSLGDIGEYSLGRGAKLKKDERIDYERFIPKKEYITADNRFSPADIEWLYLALGSQDSIQNITKREIGILSGERFGFCYFNISNSFYEKKIVDLTVANEVEFDDINLSLENYARNCLQEEIIQTPMTGKIITTMDKDELTKILMKWCVFTYSKLLSEQIFLPVETNEKKLEYTPFQAMAKYFMTLGYTGIIYSSTVCPDGKNIVLFDKNMAYPVDTIIDIIV